MTPVSVWTLHGKISYRVSVTGPSFLFEPEFSSPKPGERLRTNFGHLSATIG